jgi:hypothetical protein
MMATTREPKIERITLNADDMRAAGEAVQHLDPKASVEIARSGNGGTILTWHTNGTTGAVIYEGRIISDDKSRSASEQPEGSM